MRRTLLARLDRAFRSPWAGPALGLVTFAALMLARSFGLLAPLELRAYDQYVRWRAELRSSKQAAPQRVLLVEITEADIRRFGYPIPDGDLAHAIDQLGRMGPRAIGVDLYRDQPVGQGRAALAAAAAANANVTFIELVNPRKQDRIDPPPFVARGAQTATANMVLDPDGVVRRAFAFVYDGNAEAHPSLAWWLAERFLAQEKPPIEPDSADAGADRERLPIRLGAGQVFRFLGNDGGYQRAYDGEYQILLDFPTGSRRFDAVGFGDVVDGAVAPALVHDRVVILGTAAPSVKDDFFTPLSPLRAGGPVTKGIEVHGMVVDHLLRVALEGAKPTRFGSDWAEALWILLWCLAWGWIGVRVRSPRQLLLAFSVGLALLAASFPLFVAGWWTPVVPPALAWLVAGGASAVIALLLERRARDTVDRLLFSHVSEKVARKLWRESDELAVHGRLPAQQANVTVLMTDLEGFTKSSEKLAPAELMRWLNEYMDVMVPVVETHDGLVDGYWGDAIKADFGAPEPRSTPDEVDADAVAAVRCALAMGEAMKRLISDWRERGLPAVRMRIGINTGPVVMGSQGSAARLKYTSMGDTVNVAARLEGFDKESFEAEADPLACRVLVSESTRRRLGPCFILEDLGAHGLKGKGEAIRIYRVRGEKPSSPRESDRPEK